MSLRKYVRAVFSTVTERPGEHSPYKTGRSSVEKLNYPVSCLNEFLDATVERLVGISAVSGWYDLWPGHQVLEVRNGAGLDRLLASRRIALDGSVTGIEFSEFPVHTTGSEDHTKDSQVPTNE